VKRFLWNKISSRYCIMVYRIKRVWKNHYFFCHLNKISLLDTLITSKPRVKLLMKFFLNPSTRTFIRELASEFGESTNSVRDKLNRLSDAKIISSENVRRTIEYHANTDYSLHSEFRSLVQKYAGVDKLVVKIKTGAG